MKSLFNLCSRPHQRPQLLRYRKIYKLIYLLWMLVAPIHSILNRSADIILLYGPVVDYWLQASGEEIIVTRLWNQAHRITGQNIFFTN